MMEVTKDKNSQMTMVILKAVKLLMMKKMLGFPSQGFPSLFVGASTTPLTAERRSRWWKHIPFL
jgi:hypothetical protein